MKRLIILATAALVSTGALAQTAVIEVAPEQRTVIKRYVTEKKVAPVRLKERVSVGAVLPADVELVTVPSDWGPTYTKYRYFYSDDRVYLVEPDSRKIVTIID